MRRTLIALIALLVLAPAASAQERHEHSANMRHVKNLPYAVDNGGTPNYGTDIEFATLAGKKYALAGSYKNGLQIVDISNPDDAQIVVDLRLRRHPGRRPGLPSGRRARPDLRRLRLRHVRRRHLHVLPRGAGARLRHAQGGRDRQERHVHRRRHRPAAPQDRRLRRGRPGLAQPVRSTRAATTSTTRTRT